MFDRCLGPLRRRAVKLALRVDPPLFASVAPRSVIRCLVLPKGFFVTAGFPRHATTAQATSRPTSRLAIFQAVFLKPPRSRNPTQGNYLLAVIGKTRPHWHSQVMHARFAIPTSGVACPRSTRPARPTKTPRFWFSGVDVVWDGFSRTTAPTAPIWFPADHCFQYAGPPSLPPGGTVSAPQIKASSANLSTSVLHGFDLTGKLQVNVPLSTETCPPGVTKRSRCLAGEGAYSPPTPPVFCLEPLWSGTQCTTKPRVRDHLVRFQRIGSDAGASFPHCGGPPSPRTTADAQASIAQWVRLEASSTLSNPHHDVINCPPGMPTALVQQPFSPAGQGHCHP